MESLGRVCVCVCIGIHARMCMCMCVDIHIHMNIYIYICTCAYACIYIYICGRPSNGVTSALSVAIRTEAHGDDALSNAVHLTVARRPTPHRLSIEVPLHHAGREVPGLQVRGPTCVGIGHQAADTLGRHPGSHVFDLVAVCVLLQALGRLSTDKLLTQSLEGALQSDRVRVHVAGVGGGSLEHAGA